MDIRDAISEASSAIISEADNWQGHVGQKDFPVGTKVQFTVYTTELRYVSIYHIDSDGKVSQVFPNSKDKDSRVSGTKVIPGVDSGYDIVLSEPLGVDNVVACANKQDRYSSNTSSVETNKFRGIVLNDNETATAILSFSVSKPKNNAQQQ